jgi:hypothetical protein
MRFSSSGGLGMMFAVIIIKHFWDNLPKGGRE